MTPALLLAIAAHGAAPELAGGARQGAAVELTADARACLEAVEAELARASALRLPDQPAPYLVTYEILDGEVATASSSFGAPTSFDHGPYRNLRAEVRVGDASLDNTNFAVSFGEREGIQSRLLPQDPDALALRREIWLATDAAFKGAAEQLSAKRSARQGHPAPFPPDLSPAPPLVTAPVPRPSVDGAAVGRLADALSARFPRSLEEGGALVRDWQGIRLVASTEGTRAWLPSGFTVVRVEAIGRAADGARLRGLRWWVARTADRLPAFDEMAGEIDRMAAWVEGLASAPVEEDYLGPVLFEGPAAVELMSQLLVPEISGTPPVEEPRDPYGESSGAPPSARIGRRLLPEGWSIVDDPRGWPEEAGSYDHDFEGVAAERVEIARDGVVRDLLMSRIPRLDLPRSNGHGRALGTDRRVAMPGVVRVTPPSPRSMARLRKKALHLAREAGLSYALVVRRIEPPGLAEDFRVAVSGDAPLPGLTRPVEVYRLHLDGREEPVRGLEFVGVDRRVLRDVAMAGAVGRPVATLDTGPGGRRFNVGPVGGLPVTWMVPPVVISEMELRGQGGREPRALPMPPD